jgi:hypothetical protein
MTKKVTISVPDQLHEKMMDWKNSFNFSQVFQNAISELIQNKEDFKKRLKGDEKMTKIIERLRCEKAEAENKWFEQGKLDGLDFAKSASYKDLKFALVWETIKQISKRENLIGLDPTQGEILGDYFSDIFETYDELFFQETVYGNYMPNELYIQWELGWKEGVEAFWNEVKNKI